MIEEQVVERREAMIAKIEEADSHMRRSGLAANWFTGVDSGVQGVAGAANGELLEQLATLTEFRDKGAVECLRKGLPISIWGPWGCDSGGGMERLLVKAPRWLGRWRPAA